MVEPENEENQKQMKNERNALKNRIQETGTEGADEGENWKKKQKLSS